MIIILLIINLIIIGNFGIRADDQARGLEALKAESAKLAQGAKQQE